MRVNEYVDSDANGNQYYSELNTLKLSKSDDNNSAKTSQQSQYAALHKASWPQQANLLFLIQENLKFNARGRYNYKTQP